LASSLDGLKEAVVIETDVHVLHSSRSVRLLQHHLGDAIMKQSFEK